MAHHERIGGEPDEGEDRWPRQADSGGAIELIVEPRTRAIMFHGAWLAA